jgi:hypothetical protein
VNALLLTLLYGITVFCAITHDKKNQLLNTNADTSELAIALSTLYVTLTLYFEKKCLKDSEDDTSVINYECRIIFRLKKKSDPFRNDSKTR